MTGQTNYLYLRLLLDPAFPNRFSVRVFPKKPASTDTINASGTGNDGDDISKIPPPTVLETFRVSRNGRKSGNNYPEILYDERTNEADTDGRLDEGSPIFMAKTTAPNALAPLKYVYLLQCRLPYIKLCILLAKVYHWFALETKLPAPAYISLWRRLGCVPEGTLQVATTPIRDRHGSDITNIGIELIWEGQKALHNVLPLPRPSGV
ncbi:hypothetical protein F5X98DRAFT_372053 [Xylaria grammica]|nr:hypothetical protein F5X98DRAFT_372053 [Xylaria grammica]